MQQPVRFEDLGLGDVAFEWQHNHAGGQLPLLVRPPSTQQRRGADAGPIAVVRALVDLYTGLTDGTANGVASPIAFALFVIVIGAVAIPALLGAVMLLFGIAAPHPPRRSFRAVLADYGTAGIIASLRFASNPTHFLWHIVRPRFARRSLLAATTATTATQKLKSSMESTPLTSSKTQSTSNACLSLVNSDTVRLFSTANFGVKLDLWSQSLAVLFGPESRRRVLVSREDHCSRELLVPRRFSPRAAHDVAARHTDYRRATGNPPAYTADSPDVIDHKFMRVFHDAMRQLVHLASTPDSRKFFVETLRNETKQTVLHWSKPRAAGESLNLYLEMVTLSSHCLLKVFFGAGLIDSPANRDFVSQIDFLIQHAYADLNSWALDILSAAPFLTGQDQRLTSLVDVFTARCKIEVDAILKTHRETPNATPGEYTLLGMLLKTIEYHERAAEYVPKALLRCFFEGVHNTASILTFTIAQKLTAEFKAISASPSQKDDDFLLLGEVLRFYSPLFATRKTLQVFDIKEQDVVTSESGKVDKKYGITSDNKAKGNIENESAWDKEQREDKQVLLRVPENKIIAVPLVDESEFNSEFSTNSGFGKLVDKTRASLSDNPKVLKQLLETNDGKLEFLMDGGLVLADTHDKPNSNMSYLPFGHGRHRCPGAKLALTLISEVVLPQLFNKEKPSKMKLFPQGMSVTSESISYEDDQQRDAIAKMLQKTNLASRHYKVGNTYCPTLNAPIFFVLQ